MRYERETFRVYRLNKSGGGILEFVDEVYAAKSYRDAARLGAKVPGEYIVFTLDFHDSWKVVVKFVVEDAV